MTPKPAKPCRVWAICNNVTGVVREVFCCTDSSMIAWPKIEHWVRGRFVPDKKKARKGKSR